MRDILSKVMTGSMIAGAALLVAACGGGETETTNTAMNGLETDPMYDTGNVTAIDGMNGMDTVNGMDTMNGTTGDLNQAANAVDNAAEAIENAQENAQ